MLVDPQETLQTGSALAWWPLSSLTKV